MLSRRSHNTAEDLWLKLRDTLEGCGNSNKTVLARLKNNKVFDTQEIFSLFISSLSVVLSKIPSLRLKNECIAAFNEMYASILSN